MHQSGTRHHKGPELACSLQDGDCGCTIRALKRIFFKVLIGWRKKFYLGMALRLALDRHYQMLTDDQPKLFSLCLEETYTSLKKQIKEVK